MRRAVLKTAKSRASSLARMSPNHSHPAPEEMTSQVSFVGVHLQYGAGCSVWRVSPVRTILTVIRLCFRGWYLCPLVPGSSSENNNNSNGRDWGDDCNTTRRTQVWVPRTHIEKPVASVSQHRGNKVEAG